MEEVRLWKINQGVSGNPGVSPVEGVDATATEQLLEDVLAHSPEVLMSGLTLIGRQNETAGGPLDLLGVDEDGRLVVFELKRGTLTRDAVSQVVDYASYLDSLEPDELNRQVTEVSGRGGTERLEDFSSWYLENFQLSLSEIGRPRMVLVGLGVDERAKRMVEFLAEANVDISLITFYGFRQNGETLLARQVEVESRSLESTTKSTKRNNQELLDERLESFAIRERYLELTAIMRKALGDSVYQWPNPSGYTFYLPETTEAGNVSNRAYGSLLVPDNYAKKQVIQIVVQKRVIDALNADRIKQIADSLGSQLQVKPSGYAEISLAAQIAPADCASGLKALATAFLEAWQRRRKSPDSDSEN